MIELGLTNFRKFKELKPLSLGGVTFLVGENNSGKSTFTKAAILLSNFLSKGEDSFDLIFDSNGPETKIFSFKDNNFRHVYIDTFYQALCNRSDNGVISFKTKIDDFNIKINIVEPIAFKKEQSQFQKEMLIEDFSSCYPQIREEEPEYYKKELNRETALVSTVSIEDYKRGIRFSIDYENYQISVVVYNLEIHKEYELCIHNFDIGNFDDNSVEGFIKRIEELRNNLIKEELKSPFVISSGSDKLLDSFLEVHKSNEYIDNIRESFNNFMSVLKDIKIEYIYAHSVHQLSSYSYGISGNRDYVDQTISKFYNQELKFKRKLLSSKKSPKDVVLEWMYYLDLGDDFVIKGMTSLKNNDNQKLYVSIIEGDEEYDLSAKGIGMIQLFILLLRLATIVTDDRKIKTVIIEEPEQNLHPALQSKLADVFYDVYKEFGCKVIVETHSEYIIRKSQVLVTEINDAGEDNPFKVYYFPKDRTPYEMHYLSNGSFKENFGRGFYDEAVNLHLKIMNKI